MPCRQRIPFLFTQQRYFTERNPRFINRMPQQLDEIFLPTPDGARFKQGCGVFQTAVKLISLFADEQGQIEFRSGILQLIARYLDLLHPEFGLFHILQSKHDVKDRVPADIPLLNHLIDKLLKRVIRVFKSFNGNLFDFFQISRKCFFPGRHRSDGQCVHEHS
ncbi:Uncharacterised protein [Paenibacillus thiaminolyticus]|nr:Uncharacterised protein [Paenibacillus thiaminolyticus]